MRQPTILIANDHEWAGRSLESVLTPLGFAVSRVFTGRQALDTARELRPDVVVLDAQLPDLHGFDVCRVLRGDDRFGSVTPIIVTTAGPAGRAERLEALRAGAWDFFSQPLDVDTMLLKVRNYADAAAEAASYRAQVMLDAETGLYNRRGLLRRATEISRETYRRRQPLSWVVMVPVLEGRAPATLSGGEREVLGLRLGQLLRQVGRTEDAIGRLGEHQFTVIAPGTIGESAKRMIGRLRRAVEESQAEGPRMSVVVGLAEAPSRPEAPVEADQLVHRVQAAVEELSALELPAESRVIRIFAAA
ncbi:MAG: response regulator [Gemmatimonadales bacterium]|nr:response regulator [Gemmatimonadales bacterium]